MIQVSSPAFNPGSPIPKKYAYPPEGENVSPPISWSGLPKGTREIALICDDPDAPRAEPWVHWVVYRIPPDRRGFEEGSTGGAVEGRNDFGKTGWGGPLPPRGSGPHHYHFKVYALDQAVDLKPGATKSELLKAIRGHVLGQGELVGTYER